MKRETRAGARETFQRRIHNRPELSSVVNCTVKGLSLICDTCDVRAKQMIEAMAAQYGVPVSIQFTDGVRLTLRF